MGNWSIWIFKNPENHIILSMCYEILALSTWIRGRNRNVLYLPLLTQEPKAPYSYWALEMWVLWLRHFILYLNIISLTEIQITAYRCHSSRRAARQGGCHPFCQKEETLWTEEKKGLADWVNKNQSRKKFAEVSNC